MTRLFLKNNPNEESLKLYGRTSFLKKIHSDVVSKEMPENIALLGVRGVGKTSIIKKAFGKIKTEEYFREKSIVIVHVSIPETADSMKSFYSYINNAVLQGLDAIEKYNEEFYDRLINEIIKEKNKLIARSFEVDDATVEAVLNKTIDIIKNNNLKLLLVFDDFEKFADASKVKRTQYKYMRDLANTGKISLFISTGKDLTKVSEEINGSGLENIFTYEELRGIKELEVEDWIYDVLDEEGIEFDDDAINWIIDISGGIPEVVRYAAESVYECMDKHDAFVEEECYSDLRQRIRPLLKQWWDYTNSTERQILKEVHEHTSKDTIHRDCLIKKGYLDETDTGEIVFNTKVFEEFTVEMWEQEAKKEPEKEPISLDEIMQILTNIQTRMESGEMGNAAAEVSLEKYGELFQEDMRKCLVDPAELYQKWNLTKEIWSQIPANRQSNLAMAFTLVKFGFNEDKKSMDGVDCRPVVVMLGNFLEGFLNDCLRECVGKHLPNSIVIVEGKRVAVKDTKKSFTIGTYKTVWSSLQLIAVSTAKTQGIKEVNEDVLKSFQRKLNDCHAIRNHCDHPGEIVEYKDQKKYIQNLFEGKNSLIRVLVRVQELLK